VTPSFLRRSRLVAVFAFLTALPGCTATDDATGPVGLMAMARDLGTDVVRSLIRGYVHGRSGEIQLVPKPWNVVAQWNGGLRGAFDPRTTHATPWAYHQRVPLTLYGPGYIRSGVRPTRPVDLADLAPTFAELMGFEFEAPHGRTLREALVPGARRPDPPAVIVTVVYDGGGWNVLERWPDAWPEQRRLALSGTTYTNATIGSSPSITAPVHATIGTGAYPSTHGIPENTTRRPDGSLGDVYLDVADPELLLVDSLADRWDLSVDNRAWVGMLGYESWHLGMIGRGARVPGGDHDVAVLWHDDRESFWTNEDVYALPGGLPGPEDFQARNDELDAVDGARDGAWGAVDLNRDAYWYTGTPAFVAHQADAVLEMLRTEPIGDDAVTDLLYVEMKPGDIAGHVWNMVAPQVPQVIEAQDELMLGALIDTLDQEVGRGRYVVAITADHGQTPTPESAGGLRVDRYRLEDDINEALGAPVVESAHPSELYLDHEVLEREGLSAEDVVRFVETYRYEDGLPDGVDPGSVPRDLRQRTLFAAVLPGEFLLGLEETEVAALGPGRYAEGDLTSVLPLTALEG
jgi:Type I phosphodiesterase / nucleotide pyrophosphatase